MEAALGDEPSLGPGLIPENHLLTDPGLPLATATSSVGSAVLVQGKGREESKHLLLG
jgi:hypothetical protein